MKYEGNCFFRQRIILSLLSGKAVEIQQMSITTLHANFLRLLENITSGTVVKIGSDGTLYFKPGILIGGRYLTHNCSLERGMGYWLEALIILCLFSKSPSSILLRGITNHEEDISIDMFRNTTCKLLGHYFGLEEEPTVQIIKRGASPNGGGEIRFFSPILKKPLKKTKFVEEGLIKRIRGICYSTNVSPTICQRVVHSAKGFLLQLLPNVYLSTDHVTSGGGGQRGIGQTEKKKKNPPSPGYALYLEAETLNGCKLSVEATGLKGDLPEDLGTRCSKILCEEIASGGCVDRNHQWLILLLMSLSGGGMSSVKLGSTLTNYSIEYLRHIKDFLGVVFDIKKTDKPTKHFDTVDPNEEEENKSIVTKNGLIVSCLGCNFHNVHWKSN